MPLYQPVVPARYTARLIAMLHEQGADAAATVLAAAGIEAASLADPDFLLGFERFDALFGGLAHLTGRSDLGFELGLSIGRESHGALGLAMRHCPTVAELLQLAARHSRLMTPSFTIRFQRDRNGGSLLWRPTAGMSTTMLQAFYELHVVSLHRVLVDAVERPLPAYVSSLPMLRPRHAARYRELPGLAVRFEPRPLPEVHTRLPAALLDLRLPAAGTRGEAGPDHVRLAALGRRHAPSQQWSDWLRLILREADGVQPTQAQMAELLNVSAHTLARRLADEGLGYRQIAIDVRHRRACDLLLRTPFDLAQIAQRLGYGDSSNFIHAFRRQAGMAPAAWRAMQTAGSRPGLPTGVRG